MYEILKRENIMKILVLLPACPLMTCSNVETKIRVSVCRGVWVYSPTRVHVKTGSQHQATSSTALLLFFKTAALIELGDHPCCPTDWPGPLGDPLVSVPPPHQHWGYKYLPPSLAFYIDAGESKASTSRPEPCPHVYYFLCWQMQQAASHPC